MGDVGAPAFRKGSAMPKLMEGFAGRLSVPSGARDVQVFDAELLGFGIRKFDSSKASYFAKFNVGRQQHRDP